MAAFDLEALLKSLAKPATVQELVGRGELIDASTFARWVGFTVPAYMTDSVYDAVIGSRSRKHLLNSEHHARGLRLKSLWNSIASATAAHRRRASAAESMRLEVPAAESAGRVQIDVCTRSESGNLYLIVKLTGE